MLSPLQERHKHKTSVTHNHNPLCWCLKGTKVKKQQKKQNNYKQEWAWNDDFPFFLNKYSL